MSSLHKTFFHTSINHLLFGKNLLRDKSGFNIFYYLTGTVDKSPIITQTQESHSSAYFSKESSFLEKIDHTPTKDLSPKDHKQKSSDQSYPNSSNNLNHKTSFETLPQVPEHFDLSPEITQMDTDLQDKETSSDLTVLPVENHSILKLNPPKTVSSNIPAESERHAYVRSLMKSPSFEFSPMADSSKVWKRFYPF